MVLEIFKIALYLRDRHVFMWQSLEILNDFNTLATKMKTFFNNWSSYLVEKIKSERASFPYKTAISEAHVKIIEWRVQNGSITKNWVLPGTTLFFWKFCFSLRASYKELIWCTNDRNAHIPTLYKLEFYLTVLFPCEYH